MELCCLGVILFFAVCCVLLGVNIANFSNPEETESEEK